MTITINWPLHSNIADMAISMEAWDTTADEAIDITDHTITGVLVDQSGSEVATATITKTTPEDGLFEVSIAAGSLADLDAGQYRLFVKQNTGSEVVQPAIIIVPIFEGHPA